MKRRLNNLEFRPCTYLCKPPKAISYEIVKIQSNPFYKKESEYKNDGEWYYKDDSVSIHKSVFESPESIYTILIFRYDEKNNDYNVEFVSDRYLDLNLEEWNTLHELLSEVNMYLNNELLKNN